MALQRTKLGDIAYIPATAGSIYANPSSTKTFVRGLTLHNTNTTTEIVKLYAVPDSTGSLGTAAASNRCLNVSLTANETLLIEFPYPLVLTDENDSIQAETTTASKVTVLVLGDQDS